MSCEELLITARDLLTNKFVITVHRTILERFYKGIRQRQIVLSQYGIPPNVIALVDDRPPATVGDVSGSVDWESLAFCFYHFVSFKYWESERNTKTWEITKEDFEDHKTKCVTCYVSRLAVMFNCVMIRATVGYTVEHAVVVCIPPGSLRSLLPQVGSGKASRKLLMTSDKKYSTGNHKGEWKIVVELRQPTTAAHAAATMSTAQLSDVAELVVTIKPRCELNALKCVVFAKMPTNASVTPNDDDDDDDTTLTAEDRLFMNPIRFSAVEVLEGLVDPVPLPRSPTVYPLPRDIEEGPTLPPFQSYTLLPPEVLVSGNSAPETYRLTVVGLKSSQTLGTTSWNAELQAEVPWYFQFVDCSVRVLNVTDTTIVLKSLNTLARSRQGTDVQQVAQTSQILEACQSGGAVMIEPRATLSFTVRAEFKVTGRRSGSDHFERSQLDPRVFPQPCVFEFCMTEEHSGASTTARVEQCNKDPQLPTKLSLIKDWGIPSEDRLLMFAVADDCEEGRRYAAAVFLTDDNEFRIYRQGFNFSLSLLRLNAIAYEALMQGTSEYELEDWRTEQSKLYLLLSQDQYPQMVYGVKLSIQTTTSRVVKHCHIQYNGDDWIVKPKAPPSSTPGSLRSQPTSSTKSSLDSVREAILNRTANRPFVPGGDATNEPKNAELTRDTGDEQEEPDASPLQRAHSTSMGYVIHYDKPLGVGAFGSVFRAFDLQSGMSVAVKESIIRGAQPQRSDSSSPSSSHASQCSARTEFDVLTSLVHPNIVKVYNMDVVDNGTVFRVFMEWVPSGSIATILKQTSFRLHENVLRRYASDALKGLAYLHSKNILHLDVKPGNMLVTQEGTVKLADFGTTTFLSQGVTSLSTQHVVGTPAYMAPEIISSGKYYRGSDIWAWACCVVEMASGATPWSHLPQSVFESALPLMFHIASAKPPNHCPTIPSWLSSQLREILQCCFSPSLALRPSAEALLATEYFLNSSLPLDAEPLPDFYDKAHTERNDSSITEGGAFSQGNDNSSVTLPL